MRTEIRSVIGPTRPKVAEQRVMQSSATVHVFLHVVWLTAGAQKYAMHGPRACWEHEQIRSREAPQKHLHMVYR